MKRNAFQRVIQQAKWNIGISKTQVGVFLRHQANQFHWMPERLGTYYADPFGIERDDVLHIFCEEFTYATNRGRLVHIAVKLEGEEFRFGRPTPIMDDGTHKSYPFLLEHDSELYCLPENAESGNVALYRCTAFPLEWEKTAVLLEGVPGVDMTVVHHNGYWWMCGTALPKDNEELLLFYAKDLFGPWVPHPRNPVKRDISSARPAGSIFKERDALLRPAQDCSTSYGGSVVVQTISKVGTELFSESEYVTVSPFGKYDKGLHTMNSTRSYILIDSKRWAGIGDIFLYASSKLPLRGRKKSRKT